MDAGRFTFEAPAGLDIELRCVEGSAIASTVISHLPRAGEQRARLAFTDDDLCEPQGP